jgi:hypothetical protein
MLAFNGSKRGITTDNTKIPNIIKGNKNVPHNFPIYPLTSPDEPQCEATLSGS